jgi:hypothetical protein
MHTRETGRCQLSNNQNHDENKDLKIIEKNVTDVEINISFLVNVQHRDKHVSNVGD